MNDQSSAASPRQTGVKPLTDDCHDDNSYDNAGDGNDNEKDCDNYYIEHETNFAHSPQSHVSTI